jgi:hypothetical protein
VRAQRLDAKRWELRWPASKVPVAKYQIEERLLALDGAGALQITWRSLPFPEATKSGNSIVAQLARLDPRQLHVLKVTALGADGATIWESPLVSLAPLTQPSHGGRGWLLLFGCALIVLLVLRWRATHAPA